MKSAGPYTVATALRLTAQPEAQNQRASAKGTRSLLLCSTILAVALLAAGCGREKKESQTPLAADQQTNGTLAAAQMPTYNPPRAQQQATPVVTPSGEADIAELQRTLMRWIMRNRRRPASFEDFAATAGVPIPPPPAGKKYVITKDMHIELR